MNTQITIEPGAASLLGELHAAGFRAYAVGGCVRDSLLGLTPHDWDLCTSALPQQVTELFGPDNCIPTGLRHGTVTVKRGGRLYEITTFRTESEYSDGRHPDSVSFVPEVEADLSRRDFTINAMACNAEEGLIDPFGGRADLECRLVRAVGRAELRFKEDGLRILRLYRFAARFSFDIDNATATAARALAGRLACVSAERIQDELCRLLAAPRPGPWLDDDIFAVILPELSAGALSAQKSIVDSVPPELDIRLAALLAPLGENGARRAMRRLRCSNALAGSVALLISNMGLAALPQSELPVQARRLLRSMELPSLRKLTALCSAARPQDSEGLAALLKEAEAQRRQNACCRISQLAVNGRDLMALGIPAGPELKLALDELLEQVITGGLPNEKNALLAFAREH